MKKWTNELVNILHEDGEMQAMMCQNGEVHIYTLKKASKADVQSILEIENPTA